MTKTSTLCASFLIIVIFLIPQNNVKGQQLTDYIYKGSPDVVDNTIQNEIQFNGYTNHWWNDYKKWFRYGSLYKISIPDVDKKIIQSKIDIAEDLGIPGLWMQEGFLINWLDKPGLVLNNPSIKELSESVERGNVLVLTTPESEVGKVLLEKYPGNDSLKTIMKSYQFDDTQVVNICAFVLENGNKKIFAIISDKPSECMKVKDLMDNTINVISHYDMRKGWFGAETLLRSVTCAPGHPLEIIGKGMNEGNTWFVFSGYMDFLMKDELADWISRIKIPVITDVGVYSVYGLDNYDGLQIQDMKGKQSSYFCILVA